MSNRLWFRLVLMSFQALGCAGHAPSAPAITETLTPRTPSITPPIASRAEARPAPVRDWSIMEDSDLDAR